MTPRLKKRTMDYKNVMPNRQLFMKGGVFPYAIHANFVSKSKGFVRNISNKSDIPIKCSRQRNHANSPENRITHFQRAFQVQEGGTSSINDLRDEFANIDDLATTFCSFSPRIQAKEINNRKKLKSSFSPKTKTNRDALFDKHCAIAKPKKSHKTDAAVKIDQILKNYIYKDVGEALNKEFITLSEEFECSLDMTSSVRNKLLNFSSKRLKDECESNSSLSPPIRLVNEVIGIDGSDFYGDSEPTNKAISKTEEIFESKFEKNITKVLEGDKSTLSVEKENNGNRKFIGNDKRNYHFTSSQNDDCIRLVSSSSSESDLDHNLQDLNQINSEISFQNAVQLAPWNSRNKEANAQQFIEDVENLENLSSMECTDEDDDFFECPPKLNNKHSIEAQTDSKNSFHFDSVVAERDMNEMNEKLLNPIEFLENGIDKLENSKCNEKNAISLIKHKHVNLPVTDFKSSLVCKSSDSYSKSAVGEKNVRRKRKKILFQLNSKKGKSGNWLKMRKPIF